MSAGRDCSALCRFFGWRNLLFPSRVSPLRTFGCGSPPARVGRCSTDEAVDAVSLEDVVPVPGAVGADAPDSLVCGHQLACGGIAGLVGVEAAGTVSHPPLPLKQEGPRMLRQKSAALFANRACFLLVVISAAIAVWWGVGAVIGRVALTN